MKTLFDALRRLKPQRARSNWLWVVTLLVGVVTALIGPSEVGLRALRHYFGKHPVSGAITIVDLDDKSLAAIGKWPIPRSVFAQTLDRLFAAGARRVFFNVDFSSQMNPAEDARLAAAIHAHKSDVFLASRVVAGKSLQGLTLLLPAESVRGGAPVLNISFMYDEEGQAWRLPFAVAVGGQRSRGLAAGLAGAQEASDRQFAVDPTFDLSSLTRLSLIDVVAGHADADMISGKDILIGSTSQQLQDFYVVPPYGRIGSTDLQAIGAETLREGAPRDFGSLPGIGLAVIVALLVSMRRRLALPVALVGAVLMPLVLLPLPGTVSLEMFPGMAGLLAIVTLEAVRIARETLRRREQVNRVSGLLNLTALRELPDQPGTRLVAAHFHNFADALATLPADGEAALIGQIAARLKLGMSGAQLYHGDNGVFAWVTHDELGELGTRLDGLHALFRTPVTVGESMIDLTLSFGIDDDDARSIANRLGSALVAATEASADGTRWRMFDKSKLAEAAWKLSLLSQLDAAIDDGHLWVAYQPKLDLVTNRLIGAEALVRWTHPDKGAINPIEFVQAAEQSNRIERLTAHVLERAVLAAATINAHDIRFGMAVNLSARLLESHDIVPIVVEALEANRLDPSLLTLEVTETATIANGQSLEILHELRRHGVRISIDDYGTGLSTLEYLKKVPASEIKIDKVFVQSMMNSTSDLLMVNSTIQLAHSLGHIVVAEGVETDDVLERLRELECDIAQGYRIGRPMTFQDLARRLLAERRHAA